MSEAASTTSGAGLSAGLIVGSSRRLPLRRSSTAVPAMLERVAASVHTYHPKTDLRLLVQAFEKAEELHAGQSRRSGERYITHPVAVAEILADLGMTVPTLAAALLHDTVEDCGYQSNSCARISGTRSCGWSTG